MRRDFYAKNDVGKKFVLPFNVISKYEKGEKSIKKICIQNFFVIPIEIISPWVFYKTFFFLICLFNTKDKPQTFSCFLLCTDINILLFLFSAITSAFLVLNLSLVVLLRYCGKSRIRGALWKIAPILAWLLAVAQIVLQIYLKESLTPR